MHRIMFCKDFVTFIIMFPIRFVSNENHVFMVSAQKVSAQKVSGHKVSKIDNMGQKVSIQKCALI